MSLWMPLNQDFTDIHTHISAALPFISRVARGNFSVPQMGKICPSRSCRNLIPPNSCLALNKHEVREAPVSNQSRRQTFSSNLHAHGNQERVPCVCVCVGRGVGESHHGAGLDELDVCLFTSFDGVCHKLQGQELWSELQEATCHLLQPPLLWHNSTSPGNDVTCTVMIRRQVAVCNTVTVGGKSNQISNQVEGF